MTLVRSRRAVIERWHTQRRCRESGQHAGTDFSQNSKPYIFLKLPYNPSDEISSRTQYLFFIGHRSLPRNASSVFNHAFFMPWLSHSRISAFPVVTLLNLFTTGCICQLHPSSSSPVNAIYYTSAPKDSSPIKVMCVFMCACVSVRLCVFVLVLISDLPS